MRQFTKPKSTILTTCLVACLFAIVNCQKAPNRNGVKANPAATKTEATQQGKDQCAGDISAKVEEMRKLRNDKKVVDISSKDKNETEKNEIVKNRKAFLDNCSVVVKSLDALAEKACLIKKDFKLEKGKEAEAERNNVTLNEMKQSCTAVCTRLNEDGEKHDYCSGGTSTPAADTRTGGAAGTGGAAAGASETDAAKKAAEARKKGADAFVKINLELSKEIKEMSEDGTLFNKFFRAGKIETSAAAALKAANSTAKEVVCSLGSTTVKIDKDKKFIATFLPNAYAVATSSDLKNVSDFKGDATSLNLTRVNDNSEATYETALLNIVCLNIKSDSVDVEAFKKAMGSYLKHLSAADLKKLQDDNKKALELAAADKLRQTQTAAGGTGSTAPAGTGGAAALVAPGAAPAAVAASPEDVKKKLVADITAARMAHGEQLAKVESAEGRLVKAKGELEKANQAILTAGQQDAKVQSLLAEGRKVLASISEALKEVEAAKTKSADDQKAAAGKLKAANDARDAFVKKNPNLPSILENDDKRTAALTAVEKITGEISAEKAKVPELKSKIDAAIKAAKDGKVVEAEINTAATAPIIKADPAK